MRSSRRALSIVVTSLALVGMCSAQEQPAGAASSFSNEQLEQMVAPIALYSDSLLSSVFMASTYPLEIVEADRWLQKQGFTTGPDLEAAMKSETWDPSVKSIAMVPDVLKRMSENLDWTRDLGDAFLGQKKELMDAVQRMRAKANEAGNLKDTEQQNVEVSADNTIVIDSTSEEVVYVPTYSTEVYGGGWAYPQPYYPYMYQPGWGLVSFGAGLAVGGALWGDCNWGSGDCDIDVNRYNNFGNNTNNDFKKLQGNKQNWNHSPEHRGGVGYKNNQVAQKYGGAGGNRAPSDRARGKGDGAAAANRPAQGGGGARPNAGAGERPSGAGDRPNAGGGGAGAAAGGNRPSGGGGGAANKPAQRPASSGGGAYQGASKPQADRAASNRGSSSRGGGGGGGGGRGGGGGGGGRRGR